MISDAPSDLLIEETSDNFEEAEEVALQKRQLGSCKPNTLLFARGTLETGTMGITVGPALSSSLGSTFAAQGVSYEASMLGDYCVGLPGGSACKTQLEALVTKCPNTKVILSGYSQGAMVARICAAFASESTKAKIAVSHIHVLNMNPIMWKCEC
jgi:hypothetical protein